MNHQIISCLICHYWLSISLDCRVYCSININTINTIYWNLWKFYSDLVCERTLTECGGTNIFCTKWWFFTYVRFGLIPRFYGCLFSFRRLNRRKFIRTSTQFWIDLHKKFKESTVRRPISDPFSLIGSSVDGIDWKQNYFSVFSLNITTELESI